MAERKKRASELFIFSEEELHEMARSIHKDYPHKTYNEIFQSTKNIMDEISREIIEEDVEVTAEEVEVDGELPTLNNKPMSKKNVTSEKIELAKQNDYKISILEFATLNSFFRRCMAGEIDGITVNQYGTIGDSIKEIHFGGSLSNVKPFWYNISVDGIEDNVIVQTIMFVQYGELECKVSVTTSEGLTYQDHDKFYEGLKKVAFNNSEYKGKCIKVSVKEGNFRGIEIINTDDFNMDLILNKTQKKYIQSFIDRHKRGKNARYMLNGEPGTGKTESIRNIIAELLPEWTFIIPDFYTSTDLTTILEACEIFDQGIVVIDDIDLYLGNRDKGGARVHLGEFLSFFDGVKKRKISLLASTNDKGLVDKAAERPGRFNFTLDFGFLEDEQVKAVCDIHLPKECQVPEVYDALTGKGPNKKKIQITGAFIANLADNIIEMSEDDENWTLQDTLDLIDDSYSGFYLSQVNKIKEKISFTTG